LIILDETLTFTQFQPQTVQQQLGLVIRDTCMREEAEQAACWTFLTGVIAAQSIPIAALEALRGRPVQQSLNVIVVIDQSEVALGIELVAVRFV
jgi:hypothetical protein